MVVVVACVCVVLCVGSVVVVFLMKGIVPANTLNRIVNKSREELHFRGRVLSKNYLNELIIVAKNPRTTLNHMYLTVREQQKQQNEQQHEQQQNNNNNNNDNDNDNDNEFEAGEERAGLSHVRHCS